MPPSSPSSLPAVRLAIAAFPREEVLGLLDRNPPVGLRGVAKLVELELLLLGELLRLLQLRLVAQASGRRLAAARQRGVVAASGAAVAGDRIGAHCSLLGPFAAVDGLHVDVHIVGSAHTHARDRSPALLGIGGLLLLGASAREQIGHDGGVSLDANRAEMIDEPIHGLCARAYFARHRRVVRSAVAALRGLDHALLLADGGSEAAYLRLRGGALLVLLLVSRFHGSQLRALLLFALELLELRLDVRVDEVSDVLAVHDLGDDVVRPLWALEVPVRLQRQRVDARAAMLLLAVTLQHLADAAFTVIHVDIARQIGAAA
mmetsp:Transcript_53793/g.123766  ORF Transcript_53793/g.123766 Transcript_53793/m.123766 type:complete len:318 (-) Transcript_53793:1230-2183(-)